MARKDDLLKKPIPEMIRRIAVPASVGFFFQTMYNVTDTFWAGKLSVQAIAALSISFPIFFIILAIGSGVATGSTALISNALGAKQHKKAENYLGQATSYGFLLSIALTIVGLLSAPFLFRLLGAEEQYLQISLDYINIIYYGTIFFLLQRVLNAGLMAEGDTTKLRNFMIFGFFLNLALDPLLMYGWGPIPAMGIKGIALATIFIQFLGTLYILRCAVKAGLLSRRSLHHLIPEKRPYQEITAQGLPASVNMMTVALGIFVITYFFSWFGQDAVAAYGIATRIEQIALLPTIGLNMAALSLVGQNNGAKQYDRVYETWTRGLKYGMIILAVGAVLVVAFRRPLMRLFTDSTNVINIGSDYLIIGALIFWAYTILFLTVATLQGLKKPMYALWIGIYRQILGPLVIYWVMASVWGLPGLFWGIFILNWSSAAITLWYGRRVMKRKNII